MDETRMADRVEVILHGHIERLRRRRIAYGLSREPGEGSAFAVFRMQRRGEEGASTAEATAMSKGICVALRPHAYPIMTHYMNDEIGFVLRRAKSRQPVAAGTTGEKSTQPRIVAQLLGLLDAAPDLARPFVPAPEILQRIGIAG